MLKSIKSWLVRRRWWHYAVAAAGVVVGAYILNFGPYSHGFSQSTENWAQFGEYVGGVFGLLAFVGVLYTVELQRRQIRQQTDQATIDELHRLCRELAANIDQGLDYGIAAGRTTEDTLKERKIAQSMRGSLSLICQLPGFAVATPIDAGQHQTIKDELEKQSTFVIREFDQLAKCLQQLADRGGGSLFRDFYRDRYSDIARAMEILKFTFNSLQFWAHGTKFVVNAGDQPLPTEHPESTQRAQH